MTIILFETIRLFYFSEHAVSGWTFESMIGLYAIAIGLFMLPVWLFILFPLFLFTPSRSPIWGFIICPLLGALLACSVIFIMSRFDSPGADSTHLLVLAAVAGGATGLCSSFMCRSEHKRTERAGAANPHAFGTSGISAAEQPRMQEASGDN